MLPLFVALLAAGSASAAQVWVAPAAEKIRPNAQPPAGATAAAKIAAAKNEFESFQVVITGQAAGVSMSLEGLGDGAGHSISGRDVVLYREALINVAWPSGGDGAAGTWPDGLIPDVDPIAGEKRMRFPSTCRPTRAARCWWTSTRRRARRLGSTPARSTSMAA